MAHPARPTQPCPKCGIPKVPGARDCPACGVVFDRFTGVDFRAAEAPLSSTRKQVVQLTPMQQRAVRFMERPPAITALAWVHMVGGVVLALAGSVAAVVLVFRQGPGSVVGAAATAAVAGGLANMCGRGLVNLQARGRVLLIAFAGVGLIGIPVGTVFGALLLYYLTRPGTKVLFSEIKPELLQRSDVQELENLSRSPLGTWVIVGLALSLCFGSVQIVAFGGPRLRPFIGRMRQKATMTDIDAIADALHEYQREKQVLPSTRPVQELTWALASRLPKIPTKDAWGNDLRYEARGDEFVIASPGEDGVFEQTDLFRYKPAEIDAPGSDIVYRTKGFLTKPPLR